MRIFLAEKKTLKIRLSGDFTEEQVSTIVDFAQRMRDDDAAYHSTVDTVCAYYKVNKERLFKRDRRRAVVSARHLIVYRLVKYHNYHKSKAADKFFKNHSSAYNSMNRAEKKLMDDYQKIFPN